MNVLKILKKKNSYYLKWGWGEIKNFVNDENPQNWGEQNTKNKTLVLVAEGVWKTKFPVWQGWVVAGLKLRRPTPNGLWEKNCFFNVFYIFLNLVLLFYLFLFFSLFVFLGFVTLGGVAMVLVTHDDSGADSPWQRTNKQKISMFMWLLCA